VLDTLIPVEPLDVHITLMLPCSSFGEVGILDLAAQGRARLTGAPPPAPEVLPEVLAFDLAPAPAASRKELARQFSELQPGITAHIQAVHTGVFFGHAATLSIRCARPTSAARVRELLRLHGGVRLTRNIGPARPSQVAEQSKVVCAELVIDGTWVSLWVAADGDQLYGPELIAEVLAALTKV
jgi:aspartate-semialdehyde dehydrogenase